MMRSGSMPRGAAGAVLLEVVIALFIFVAGGLTVLAVMDRSAGAMVRVREMETAADLARSAMPRLEMGEASAESLDGPVPEWRDEADGTFDDELPPPSLWNLEVRTEPSEFNGLTRVTVRAFRLESAGSDRESVSFSLTQLVRLAAAAVDDFGAEDPLNAGVGQPASPAGSGRDVR